MRVNVSKLCHYKGHHNSVYTLHQGVGKTFFSSGGDGLIIHWNLEEDKGETVARIQGKVFSLHYLPDANHLLAGTMEGDLFIIDTATGHQVNKLHFGDFPVFAIEFLPASGLFAVLLGSGTLVMLDASYQVVGKVELAKASLRALARNAIGKAIAIGSSDHKVYLNFDPLQPDWKLLEEPTHSVFSVAFDRTGRKLIAGSRDACLYVYDVEKDYQMVQKINAHLYTINHIISAESQDLFFTAGRDKHVKIWNSQSLELVKVLDYEKLDAHTHSVNKLLLLENDKLLISASDDRSVMVWQLDITD